MYPVSDLSTRRVSPLPRVESSNAADPRLQISSPSPVSPLSQSPSSITLGGVRENHQTGNNELGQTINNISAEERETVRTPKNEVREIRNNVPAPVRETGNNAPSRVLETRLIVGIDFGTTYTGVAFATPRGATCPLSKITTIKEWGVGMGNHDKVPSVISYNKPSSKFQQWGSSLSPDAVTMVRKKLELGPHSLQGELDLVVQVLEGMKNLHFGKIIVEDEVGNIPAYACKSPEQIVTDYLIKIFTYLDRTVEKFSEAFRKQTITDIVVTIPTNWPYEALNSTYRAITRAGFNHSNFPRMTDIMFITESEAAARYTIRHYEEEKGMDFLNDNSYFVLCDAGGGTVDVVSYKVLRTRPTLELQQIGRPTGSECGSVFINQRFKRWLRKCIGDSNYRALDPHLNIDKAASHASETREMRELMKQFDFRKETFTPDSRDMRLDLPAPLDNLSVRGVIDSGVLTVTRDLMESFFDDCLDHIMRLVRGHMKQLEAVAGGKAKNLFLVGGFGSSAYLRYYIQETLKEYRIRFRTPDTSWTAIVQGAVVCGVDNAHIPSVIRAKSCPYSYGVCMDEAFQETNHAHEDVIEEADGTLYAQGQLLWLLNQGDVLLASETRKVKKEFDVSFLKTQDHFNLPIYQHCTAHGEEEEDRPDRFKVAANEVTQVAVLNIDLNQLRSYVGGNSFRESMYKGVRSGSSKSSKLMEGVFFSTLKSKYQVTLELVLEMSWESLRASVLWKGRELARGVVR